MALPGITSHYFANRMVKGGDDIAIKVAPDAAVSFPVAGSHTPKSNGLSAKAVELFYASSRSLKPDALGQVRYTDERDHEIHYGICYVSVPATHTIGNIERPAWFFSESPSRDFILSEVDETDPSYFIASLRTRLSQFKQSTILLYVHGHDQDFTDAAFRAAQLKVDLQFGGQVMFFFWPSAASVIGYDKTVAAVQYEKKNLEAVLEKVVSEKAIAHIVLVTHSAGAFLGVSALEELRGRFRNKTKIDELVLASPDIDRDVFMRDLAPTISQVAKPSTVYASGRDRALELSSYVTDTPRLGLISAGPVKIEKTDVIDTSDVKVGFLGHSDYAESPQALNDLSLLIDKRIPAQHRPTLVAYGNEYKNAYQLRDVLVTGSLTKVVTSGPSQ